MAKNSKAYRAALDKLEPGKFYGPDEAVAGMRDPAQSGSMGSGPYPEQI